MPIFNWQLKRNGTLIDGISIIQDALFGDGIPDSTGNQMSTGLVAQVLIGDSSLNKYKTIVTALKNLELNNAKNSDAHFNNFHIILRPPTLKRIEADGQNLLATKIPVPVQALQQDQKEEVMNKSLVAMLLGSAFSTNVAFASDYEITSATNGQSIASGVKISGSFSSCEVIPGISVNSIKPDFGGWGFDIFPKKLIDTLEPNVDGREFVAELTPTLRLYSPPKHGVIDDYTRGYKPKPGFEGIDTASFSFEYKGKTYLSIQKFVVSIPRDDETLPLNCKDAWKLLKLQKHSLLENGSDPAISFTNWSQLQNIGTFKK